MTVSCQTATNYTVVQDNGGNTVSRVRDGSSPAVVNIYTDIRVVGDKNAGGGGVNAMRKGDAISVHREHGWSNVQLIGYLFV